MVKQAQHCDEATLPSPWPDPMHPSFKSRFKALKKAVTAKASDLGVAPEMLMRRRDIETLVMQDLAGEPFSWPTGWRGECLNDALAQALEERSL
ncbi:hypothetical protein HSBAA_41520 [Vreelandella sulfidaeris]|uniref:Ribonuclease D C-terminal HRDC domain-containing protein n=1 Tax=Vreelandella sulfidaeris TaxID=115553 RepID=A0A455U9H9_9GAMM|nr:hypothetical protein HSBAA_41520 [Halomonas sulfidaeris]